MSRYPCPVPCDPCGVIAAAPTVFLAIAVLIVCGRARDWAAAALALLALLALLAPALLLRLHL